MGRLESFKEVLISQVVWDWDRDGRECGHAEIKPTGRQYLSGTTMIQYAIQKLEAISLSGGASVYANHMLGD